MELFQLKYAVTLAEHRNFSKAAQTLYITQPTLSQQIINLEEELGFPLFFRDSKHVIPSLAGERFLQDAKRVINEFEALNRNMQSIKCALGGEIIFGASSISGAFISNGIQRFSAELPQVNFKLIEAFDLDLILMVRERDLNVSLISLPKDSVCMEGLCAVPILEEHICAMMSKKHPLARQEFVALEELACEKLLFSSPRSSLRKIIIERLEKIGKKPLSFIDISNTNARVSMIMNGMVSFTLSRRRTWSEHTDLELIPIFPYMYNTLSLIFPVEEKQSFAVNALVKIMDEEIRKQL